MRYLKRYGVTIESNLFGDNAYEMIKDIASKSYIIEDEGYKIVYFASIYYPYSREYFSVALGSSYNIYYEIERLRDRKMQHCFLEIVDDIPRRRTQDEILMELKNKDNLFDHILKSYKLLLPEYKISDVRGYIKFE